VYSLSAQENERLARTLLGNSLEAMWEATAPADHSLRRYAKRGRRFFKPSSHHSKWMSWMRREMGAVTQKSSSSCC